MIWWILGAIVYIGLGIHVAAVWEECAPFIEECQEKDWEGYVKFFAIIFWPIGLIITLQRKTVNARLERRDARHKEEQRKHILLKTEGI